MNSPICSYTDRFSNERYPEGNKPKEEGMSHIPVAEAPPLRIFLSSSLPAERTLTKASWTGKRERGRPAEEEGGASKR